MTSQLNKQRNWVVTASLSILAMVAIAFVLHYTQDVLVPFVVSIFIGSMVSPLMDVMELKYKVRHSISVVIALIVVVVATLLFGAVLLASIKTIVNKSTAYSARFEQLASGISQRFGSLLPQSNGDAEAEKSEESTENPTSDAADPVDEPAVRGTQEPGKAVAEGTKSNNAETPPPDDEENAEGTDVEPIEGESDAMQQYMRDLIPRFAAELAGSALSLISGGVLTLIFVMFVLAGRDPHVIRQGVYREIDTQVRSYIGTKVALSMSTGILVWVIFWSIDMPMAAVFGLLAFLLNFIPSVGSIIATIIPIPFALALYPDIFHPGAQHGVDQIAFLVAVVCLPGCVQLLIGNVLEPKLMGNDLQLHPITILLSLAIWGLLWGPIGMLLAVPMTAIIRIVLMKFEITQAAGRALAGELPDLDAAQDAESGDVASGA